MTALLQLLAFYAILVLVFKLFRLNDFLLTAAIVSLPFRTDYSIVMSNVGGWVDGIVVSISDVLMICLSLRLYSRNQLAPGAPANISRGMIYFTIACGLSMVNSNSRPSTFYQVVMLLQVFALYYFVVIRSINSRKDLDLAVRATTISLFFQGALGCLQFTLGKDWGLFSTGNMQNAIVYGADGMMRAVGTRSGKPNAYGMIVASLLLFNLGVLRYSSVSTFFRMTALATGLCGLVFSQSRGAWLGFAAGLLGFLLYSLYADRGQRLKLLAVSGAVAFLGGLILLPIINQRIAADDNNSAQSRVPLTQIAFQMIATHPVLGVGGNTYKYEMKDYVPKNFEQQYVDQVHNHYLLVFAETGLVGIVCWLLLMKAFVMEGVTCARIPERGTIKGIGLGFVLVLAQVSVHWVVETNAGTIAMATLLVYSALATAALSNGRLNSNVDAHYGEVDYEMTRAHGL